MGSIDNFLHAHSHDENIKIVGKMAIVDAILDYERQCDLFIDMSKHPFNFKNEGNVRKSWLAVFMNALVRGVTVQGNLETIFDRIAIINFNYDRCVEQYLHTSLQRGFGISDQKATDLLSKLLIHHPYGRIAQMGWEDSRKGLHLGGDAHDPSNVDLETLSLNIKTFNEEVEKSDALSAAHNALANAKNIVFLGFHFHDQNVSLIAPSQAVERVTTQYVYASTFGRSAPEKHIIEMQIDGMFRMSSHQVQSRLDIEQCGKLLADFGTTLTV
jgi:hypothetical protein